MSKSVRDVLDEFEIYYEESYNSDDLLFLCPFHKDTNVGSARINEKLGVYNCFACGAKGNLNKFVSTLLDCSYEEARLFLTTGESNTTEYNLDELKAKVEQFSKRPKEVSDRHEIKRIIFKFLEAAVAKDITIAMFQRWYPVLVYFAAEGTAHSVTDILNYYSIFQSEILKEKHNG